jgi:structure-specific endonuclease subunit SLX1
LVDELLSRDYTGHFGASIGTSIIRGIFVVVSSTGTIFKCPKIWYWVGADIFRWAWQNPHVTLHITPEQRIQHAKGRKKSGQPKRPKHTVTSLLSNLHILLRAPYFARWPLELRFFSQDVHKTWTRGGSTAINSIPASATIPPPADLVLDSESKDIAKTQKLYHGISILTVDYSDQKHQVEKAKDIIDFEREGSCVICRKELDHEGGLHAICPKPECNSITHLTCLSKLFLKEDDDIMIPIGGECPSCKADLRWVDIVKELTLRMRGQKEVENLLKVKRVRKRKEVKSSQAIVNSDEDDLDVDKDDEEELATCGETHSSTQATPGDDWYAVDNSDDSDAASFAGNVLQAKEISSCYASKPNESKTIIEDSDWDDAEILD